LLQSDGRSVGEYRVGRKVARDAKAQGADYVQTPEMTI
jgi:hypothetical protein